MTFHTKYSNNNNNNSYVNNNANSNNEEENVYLSDQSGDDLDINEDEKPAKVTKKIKKPSYVSRASQLQTFKELKSYFEPFFQSPRSTSTLSRFFVIFSTEPKNTMEETLSYLERLDE